MGSTLFLSRLNFLEVNYIFIKNYSREVQVLGFVAFAARVVFVGEKNQPHQPYRPLLPNLFFSNTCNILEEIPLSVINHTLDKFDRKELDRY